MKLYQRTLKWLSILHRITQSSINKKFYRPTIKSVDALHTTLHAATCTKQSCEMTRTNYTDFNKQIGGFFSKQLNWTGTV